MSESYLTHLLPKPQDNQTNIRDILDRIENMIEEEKKSRYLSSISRDNVYKNHNCVLILIGPNNLVYI